MIAVRLKGGMGNQMFQYAFGKRMAQALDTVVRYDLSSLLDRSKEGIVFRNYDLDIFAVKVEFLQSPHLLRMFYKTKSSAVGNWMKHQASAGKNYVKETQFHVMEDVLQHPQNNTLYNGWWQSERYFEAISDQIRKDFAFKNPVLSSSKDLLQQIQTNNSVCLNVRRTDFLTVSDLNTTNLDYFKKSSQWMIDNLENPHFYVFSDDMEWCEQNIKIKDFPVTYVSHDLKGEKFGNYLRLMKNCKHYIIPNSSFAWWAVWLNENASKKVIAPKMWFNNPKYDTTDLVPSDWIRF